MAPITHPPNSMEKKILQLIKHLYQSPLPISFSEIILRFQFIPYEITRLKDSIRQKKVEMIYDLKQDLLALTAKGRRTYGKTITRAASFSRRLV